MTVRPDDDPKVVPGRRSDPATWGWILLAIAILVMLATVLVPYFNG